MKCARPKWMLRQLFQVFFISILSILIVAAVLAYLVYFLPAYPPVSLISSSPYQFSGNHRGSSGQSAIKSSASLSSSSRVDASEANHFQDLQLVPLETASIRHVSRHILQRNEDESEKRFDWNSLRVLYEDGGTKFRTKCSMFTCFDIHRCGGGDGANESLSIYVYPIYRWVVDGRLVQKSLSIEFYQFLQSIKRSPYYVRDPEKACIFVPSIDLLNLNRLAVSAEDILAVLSSLEHWKNAGQNHLLLTMFPGNSPLLRLKTNAIIASSGLFVEHYRLGFHVPVISPSPLLFSKSRVIGSKNSSSSNGNGKKLSGSSNKQAVINDNNVGDHDDYALQQPSNQQHFQVRNSNWIAVAILQGAFSFDDLVNSANHDSSILVLDYCHDSKMQQNYSVRCSRSSSNSDQLIFNYPEILSEFDFCLVVRDLASPVLWEMMSLGCIPVIIADHQRLPFDEFIDWRSNSIQLYQHEMHQLSSILNGVSDSRRRRLKAQVQFTFRTYFQDMRAITETLMMVFKERVFSHYARSIKQWNKGDEVIPSIIQSPLFNPVTAPKDAGFTAVILAYDRVASLFSVIQRVSQVPSLAKVLVVWNNQLKDPPSLDSWPKLGVPVKIIKTKENKMSNRFFPYDEIETEAVFSLDDDIVMLTVDEMEFGFETWREFPDRLVGFPSRSHVWDNTTRRWKYESEWTSEISMVLTGAAFYHKYWHYAYTNELSRDIRDWVDAKMNCEDIAMNFLVSARTGKSPIKVTPRKKFKCPTCSNNEMLSSDTGHMVERTDCINKFTQIIGFMPLIPTEFRVDPVLYKVEGMPNQLKRYHDMGTL